MDSSRAFLDELFRIAVAAAHPANCLVPHLPDPPSRGRLIVLSAGKAAGSMTEVAEQHYLDELRFRPAQLAGMAVTRHGYGRPTRIVTMTKPGIRCPTPRAWRRRNARFRSHRLPGLRIWCWCFYPAAPPPTGSLPAAGLSLAEKQAVNRALLKSGAAIGDINTVRKHLSRIKGGRLAQYAHPAQLVTLAISDVPGDDPAVIGSGPTVPDPTTLTDARAVVARFAVPISAAVERALADAANESPKPGRPGIRPHRLPPDRPAGRCVSAPPSGRFTQRGYECVFLGDRVEGEARDVAAAHARLAMEQNLHGRRSVILSGGELTVTIRGKGRGGPNQEYALAWRWRCRARPELPRSWAIPTAPTAAAGSPDDPAGAFIDATTLARAHRLGLDPAAFLADNDSTGFFERFGDLLRPGPTFTNVNDFRAILIGGT